MSVGFFLRKLVGEAVQPVPVVLLLLVGGAALAWRGRARWGKGLAGAGVLLLWAASCMPLARTAVRPLESAHPPFPGDSVEVVVILGGGHVSQEDLPAPTMLNGASIYRVTEGVRIARAQPWARVAVSGYGGPDDRSNAEVAREAAVALGVDPARIHVEPRARDTAEEAELLAPLLAGRRFALVTSATHMPRAVRIFRAEGLDPMPAPTGYLGRDPGGFGWRELLPRADALLVTGQVWYEWMASLWAAVRP